MSYQRALDIIHLRPTSGIGEQETLDHPGLMAAVTGRDPWENPHQAYIDTYKALDVDWIMGIPNPRLARDTFAKSSSVEVGRGGRMTEWGLSGSYWREEYLFHDVEDVLRYDPLANEPHVEMVSDQIGKRSAEHVQRQQAEVGDSLLISSIYYTTLFQWGIMVFGWPLFLTAAGAEPDRFQRVLEGFAEISRRNLADWAATKPPLVLIHDDIAMQHSMVFHPRWYRQRLFPLYEKLLEPLFADPDIRVCFVSDGDYTPVLPDLAALGFHGFLINPNMDLGAIAAQYGRDHFLVGNVDTAVLTFGNADDIRHEVERAVEQAKPCAGHFIKAMGDLPHNIPLDNIRTYFDTVARYR
ncbi:MAG: hypothetical protein GX552_13920 [Chloroflexi bacterium]|jgi:hypothetical protein|nr:hypothetical protein [Chloroflexota bacterium]